MTAASRNSIKEPCSGHDILRNKRQLATTGCAIGILHIDTNFPLILGNAQNALTFDFPVRYQQVDGLSIPDLLSGSEPGKAQVVRAAMELQDAGVAAVVGACGSLINYQSATADALDIPVFASVLLTVPLLLSSLGGNRQLGIVFASADSFTSKVHEECGLRNTERIVVTDCSELEAFCPLLRNEDCLESRALEEQLVHLATALVHNHPDIGAIMLQCSELAPYAHAVRAATELPVFDVTNLIRWAHSSALQHRP